MSKQNSNQEQSQSLPKKGSVIEPEVPGQTRRQQLEDLSDAELKELYFNTFAAEAPEGVENDVLIHQIETNVPYPATAAQVGPEKKASAADLKKAGKQNLHLQREWKAVRSEW
jgi:hypothetical protein